MCAGNIKFVYKFQTMKKLLIPIIAIISFSVFCSSCKKSNNDPVGYWTCYCTIDQFVSAPYSLNVNLYNMKKSIATDSCNAIQVMNTYVSPKSGSNVGGSLAKCQLY